MSATVIAGKSLEFNGGESRHKANVGGSMLEKRVHFQDNFTQEAINADVWTSTVGGTNDTIAISETAGGSLLLTTGEADNDASHLSGAIIWNGTTAAVAEARITITDVSGTAIFFGFSDAKAESASLIAIGYPGNTLTTTATNAAGFVVDADHATSSIMCEGVKADADATSVDSGTDWADGETKNLRVELDTAGAAAFFLDGTGVGFVASAVTTATLLCVTLQVQTRANDGANTVRLHRIDVWADET
jgi:hypothetical protein